MTVCQRIYDNIGTLIEDLIETIDDIPTARLEIAHQNALEQAHADLDRAVAELRRLRAQFE